MEKETKKKVLSSKEKRKNVINCVIAVLVAVIFLFPIYWILAMSFKSDAESFGKIVTYYPHNFTIDPWVKNFTDADFLSSLKNSIMIALISMVFSMVFGVPAAYGMGRYKVPGGKGFLLTFLVTQMLPASLMLTPMYLIFNKLHLLGTYIGPALAISSGTIPFIVVTLRPYFKGVPTSLDDAARIDGCGVYRSFFKIMLPAIKTGIITVVVISFLNGWNDLAYSMTFNVKPDMRPLTANIYKFQSKYGTKWNCIMAYGAILVLPVIILFVFLQKYIVGGLTAGSVKESSITIRRKGIMTDIVKREGEPSGDFRSDNNFLLGFFKEKDGALHYRYDAERVIVEPWGANSLRVRASKMPQMPEELWALDEKPEGDHAQITIHEYSAEIVNGKIKAVINNIGKLTFYNQKGEVLLEEYVRNREDMFADTCSSLEVEAREFKPIIGGDYALTMRFESNPDEKLYGMGQYQQKFLNVKGAELELAHRNSQASVPFALSSLGYGFLWNNPAIGRVNFNKNITTWQVASTKKLDYWITAGDTPAEIEEAYADATGKVPMMPEYGMGFWQCKLRYQTQDELLEVAREYKRRGIPIDVIVVDFFHWPKQGDWRFDPTY